MKIVTSVTTWNDAVGKRISITYSEVDDQGTVISDNKRIDRVITDPAAKKIASDLLDYAQEYIDSI